MTKDERIAAIDAIVRSAPKRFGMAEAARRNAESLDDAKLSELRDTLMAVRNHSAGVRASAKGDSSKKEAALVARREHLYAKLRGLSSKSAGLAGTTTGRNTLPGVDVPAAEEAFAQDKALLASIRFWDQQELRPKDELTERLLKVVSMWVLRFEQQAFDHVFSRSAATSLLKSDALRSELLAYYELALGKLGRDTLRIIRHHLIDAEPIELDADVDRRMLDWLLTDRALSNPSLDIAFYNATRGTIPHVRAMESLAKVRFLAQDYRADTIVSMSGGGEMVGDFLAGHERRERPQRVVLRRHGSGFHFAGKGRKAVIEAKRILLVDDVLNRGGALATAHSQIAELAKAASIQIVALVGTAEARNGLMHQHQSAYVPTVTVDDETDIPWGREGSYVFAGGKHTFGAGSSRPWSVASRELNQIVDDLAADA